ncbi:unnamed protein product [Prunus brigantina]
MLDPSPRIEVLKFKDNMGTQKKFQTSASKANQATTSNKGLQSFTSNPAELINEFASYIQKTKGSNDSKEVRNVGKESSTALLNKFAEFLAETQNCSAKETSGTLNAFATALNDIATKKTIGEGIYLDGLYYLFKDFQNSKGFQVSSNFSPDQSLWHQRLAHPSEQVLSILFPNLVVQQTICDSCQLSKSTRLLIGIRLIQELSNACFWDILRHRKDISVTILSPRNSSYHGIFDLMRILHITPKLMKLLVRGRIHFLIWLCCLLVL